MATDDKYSQKELEAMIRDVGLRCTSSRATVLAHLARASVPMSHADLAEALVPEGFDQATIYRNLSDLTDNGLLHRLDPGDHIWRFEFRGQDSHDEDHPHFMCDDCGEISCLAPVDITFGDDERTSPTVGEVNEIFLRGRCAHCA